MVKTINNFEIFYRFDSVFIYLSKIFNIRIRDRMNFFSSNILHSNNYDKEIFQFLILGK